MSSSRKTIVFIDVVHASLAERLTQGGFQCVQAELMSAEQIQKEYGNAHGLVVRSRFPIHREFISSFSQLKFIARFGAGMENIDVAYAEANGIRCLRAPEGNQTAVAEQALGMLLALLHRVIISSKEVAEGKWLREENRGTELESKTVGIIGYGYMGKAFADRVKAFGCEVLVYDKYIKVTDAGVRQVCLEELMGTADVVSLHLPLSEETLQFVDTQFIQNMAKPFYLINTARGQHVVSEAVQKGLENGKVLGACLDVLDREKSSFETAEQDAVIQQLATDPRVIITPHIAGWSHESNQKMADALLEKIMAL